MSHTMSSSKNKRQRTLNCSQSDKDGKSQSYSHCCKNKDVLKQYIKSYKKYIFTQNLNMNYIKDKQLVFSNKKATCQDLWKMKCIFISLIVYFKEKIIHMINLCQNANEAMINDNVTTLILLSIKALYSTNKAKRFKDFIDLVKTQWYESWSLRKSRLEFDLIVDFFHFVFVISKNEKLINYTFFENLTRSINKMCFSFLMCKVKCDNKELDYVDQQNMHNCNVTIKTLLKLEHKTN